MQSRTSPPREHLTSDEVDALITGDGTTFYAGLEIVDTDGTVVADISEHLDSGTVSHNNYATIHASCDLKINLDLPWASARVRPFVVLKNQTTEARFDLGVYFLSSPVHRAGIDPTQHEAEGFGVLLALDSPAAQTYRVAAGTNVIDAVRSIIDAEGAGVPYFIESSSEVLASDRIWPLDAKTTWLNIINELLRYAGYIGLHQDWTGAFTSFPYRRPADRGSEWTYNTDPRTTILHEERERESEYFDTPNHWVFIRTEPASGISEPGTADVYEVVNQSDGATSIDGRGGLRQSAVYELDVASAAALQSRGDEIVDRDKHRDATFTLTTDLNPLHWHFDVVTIDDPELGPKRKTVSHEWTLDLSSGQMTHTLREV